MAVIITISPPLITYPLILVLGLERLDFRCCAGVRCDLAGTLAIVLSRSRLPSLEDRLDSDGTAATH